MHPFFDVPTPFVLAHRGASAIAPENTLAAFERALAAGAAVLESDVRATRDGVPVLLHAPDLARTTDGHGAVGDLDLDGVGTLDAGCRFSPDGGRTFPYRGRGIRVPTLDEALAAFPDARFNLEVKGADPGLAAAVVAIVARRRRPERTLLTAGDDAVMRALRDRVTAGRLEVALGASEGEARAFIASSRRRAAPPAGPMALQVPVEHDGERIVSTDLVAHAHRHGVQVHVWVVNDPAQALDLLALGVDALVTDDPGRIVPVCRAAARGV